MTMTPASRAIVLLAMLGVLTAASYPDRTFHRGMDPNEDLAEWDVPHAVFFKMSRAAGVRWRPKTRSLGPMRIGGLSLPQRNVPPGLAGSGGRGASGDPIAV